MNVNEKNVHEARNGKNCYLNLTCSMKTGISYFIIASTRETSCQATAVTSGTAQVTLPINAVCEGERIKQYT